MCWYEVNHVQHARNKKSKALMYFMHNTLANRELQNKIIEGVHLSHVKC